MDPRRNPYSDVSKRMEEAVKTLKENLFKAMDAMLIVDRLLRYIRGWEDRLVRIYESERERDRREGFRPAGRVEPQVRQVDPDRDRNEASSTQGSQGQQQQHYSDIDSDSLEEGPININGASGFIVREGDSLWYGN